MDIYKYNIWGSRETERQMPCVSLKAFVQSAYHVHDSIGLDYHIFVNSGGFYRFVPPGRWVEGMRLGRVAEFIERKETAKGREAIMEQLKCSFEPEAYEFFAKKLSDSNPFSPYFTWGRWPMLWTIGGGWAKTFTDELDRCMPKEEPYFDATALIYNWPDDYVSWLIIGNYRRQPLWWEDDNA